MHSEDYERLKFKRHSIFDYKYFLDLDKYPVRTGLAMFGGMMLIIILFLHFALLGEIVFKKDYVHIASKYNYKDVSFKISKGDTLVLRHSDKIDVAIFFNNVPFQLSYNAVVPIGEDGVLRIKNISIGSYLKYYRLSDRRAWVRQKQNS